MSITCDYKFIKGKNIGLNCGRICSKYSELNKCNSHGAKYYKKVSIVELPSELVDTILTTLPIKQLIKINKYYNNYKYCHYKQVGSNYGIRNNSNKFIRLYRIENPYNNRKSQYKYIHTGHTVLRVLRINEKNNYFYAEPVLYGEYTGEIGGVKNITIPKKIFDNLLSVYLYSVHITNCYYNCSLRIDYTKCTKI